MNNNIVNNDNLMKIGKIIDNNIINKGNIVIVGKITLAVCIGIGMLKGLYLGLLRTTKRIENNDIDDGGPVISKDDDFISTIGSTGVIVTTSTIMGGLQGACVGVLAPITISFGTYNYCKNVWYYRKEITA